MANYAVILYTSNVPGAGTNADVAVELHGTQGNTGRMILDNPGDDRERGNMNIYCLSTATYLGDITKAILWCRQADNDGPDWHLAELDIIDRNVFGNRVIRFPFHQWIGIQGRTDWFSVELAYGQYGGAAPYFKGC